MATIIELGQKTKAKYPEYADMTDVDVGRKVKSKYPTEYADFSEVEIKPVEPKKSTLRKVGDFFTSSTQKFGKTIGEAINAPKAAEMYSQSVDSQIKAQNELLKQRAEKKARGEDVSKIDELLKSQQPQKVEDFTGDVINKTAGQVIGEGIGTGLEALSGGLLSSGKNVLTNKTLSTFGKVKAGGLTTAPYTAVAGGANAMQEGGGVVDTLKGTAIGGAIGLGLGGGLGYAGAKIGQKVAPTIEQLTTKVDDNIRNIFKGTVGDVNKINESAFKAKKGLELLTKESKDLSIPDIKAPLGSKTTKPFDIKKATPNELLSSVLEMDKKIATNARKAVETAKQQGLKIDTFEAESLINSAVKNGEIPKATGTRMLQQIKTAGDDPVKIHDWVQEINTRYGKKYQRGTIDDTALGKVADDVADIFRNKLDVIVDRKGYAEAFSNNQELKRMLVAIAKKANKHVNFGDIGTDAGLDLGISILTGNPAYMARTIGTGLFKGLISNIRNQSGLKAFKKAADAAGKLGTETKLPSSEAKMPNFHRLEAPKVFEMNAPKAPTTFEAPAQRITRYEKPQLQLPAPKVGTPLGFREPIKLPTSVRETNIGLDQVKNADINKTKFNKTGDMFTKNQKTGEVKYNPKKPTLKLPNKQGGFSKTGTALSGAGALSLGIGAKKLSDKPSEAIQPKEVKEPETVYSKAINQTEKKYGVKIPKGFLEAVREQESSNKDKSNLRLSMGITDSAMEALGKDALPNTSIDNVMQNAANYLASRAIHKPIGGGADVDMSKPENLIKWYVQKYVGLLPGETRMINGEPVPYQKIYDSFEKILKANQE